MTVVIKYVVTYEFSTTYLFLSIIRLDFQPFVSPHSLPHTSRREEDDTGLSKRLEIEPRVSYDELKVRLTMG